MNFAAPKQTYYTQLRYDMAAMIHRTPKSILDIGCGQGVTLRYLSDKFNLTRAVGIEKNPDVANSESQDGIEILCLDIESDPFPAFEEPFDCILLGDVLEHLYNPWLALENIKKYLSPDGEIIISIPNINHYTILKDMILNDKWEYSSNGLLDFTHIRFFTYRETINLIRTSGLRVEYEAYHQKMGPKIALLNKLLFNKLHRFTIFQYYFRVVL